MEGGIEMTEHEKIDCFNTGYSSLDDEGKQYVLAIAQALVFAQNTFQKQ